MAYTPTEWSKGDIITAEKLNNIENGISNNLASVIDTGVDAYVPNHSAGIIKIGDNNYTLRVPTTFYYIQELYIDEVGYVLPDVWNTIYQFYDTYNILPCLVNNNVSLQNEITLSFTYCTEIKSVYNSTSDEWTYSVSFGDKVYTTNNQYEGQLVRQAIQE